MINELLEFEKNSNIFKYRYKFNNEMIWPYFRAMIFDKVRCMKNNVIGMGGKIYFENNLVKLNITKNPFAVRQTDILYIQSSSDFVINDKNKYYNKIINYYLNLYPDKTVVLEWASIQKHPSNRVFENVKYLDFIDNIVESKYIISRKKVNYEDMKTTKELIRNLKINFPIRFDEGFYTGLEKEILKMSIKIRYYTYYYSKLIHIIKPKIIFVDNGCYGAKFACLLRIANDIGICTGEFQHGYISNKHYAYNYPKEFINSDYCRYLPKYFLGMGQYWLDRICLPIGKVVIGNPHLYSKLSVNKQSSKSNILIVSDWLLRDKYLKIVEEFCSEDIESKYNIIFRIHPVDKSNFELYSALTKYKGVQFSDYLDIYDDINRCENIVGCYSTALFECIPFDKNIFVLENEFTMSNMDKNIGAWIKNGKQLFDMIDGDLCKKKEYDDEYYWNSNWKKNYVDFIESVINKGEFHE